jgi:CRP-like cAMP-binding protein
MIPAACSTRRPFAEATGLAQPALSVSMVADANMGVRHAAREALEVGSTKVDKGTMVTGHDAGGGRILIRQKINQSDLAAMAGIARENMSRIINDWKRQSVVSGLSGYYCLKNGETLEREAKL